MSSAGQIVGGAIGYFVGGAFPIGAALGAQIGITIGGLIDPPRLKTQHGPRLSDLTVQTSTSGAPIPRIYGTVATHGNVFWVEGDRLKESVKKTKSGGKGGGGQTTKTYSYSATFAVGLCKGPIAGVRRIWVGANLIYDAGSEDLEAIIASNQGASGFKVYLGDEAQLPNPRMQADKGVSNTPGYRGLAYIVFYDLGLAEYGNSLMGAQVKVEVVKVASFSLWQNIYTRDTSGSLSGTWYAYSTHLPITRSIDGVLCRTMAKTPGGLSTDTLVCVEHSYFGDAVFQDTPPTSAYFGIPSKYDGDQKFIAHTSGAAQFYIGNGGVQTVYTTGFTGLGTAPASSCVAEKDFVFFSARAASSTTHHYAFFRGQTPFLTKTVASNTIARCVSTAVKVYVLYQDALGTFVDVYDRSTFSFLGQVIPPANLSINYGCYIDNGQLILVVNEWAVYSKLYYDLETFTLQATETLPTSSVSSGLTAWGFGDVLIRHYTGGDRPIYVSSKNKITGNQIPLSSIIQSETLQSNLIQNTDINTSTLTDQVRGYRVSETSPIRNAINPLQAAWPFDVVQRGYQLHFVRRPKTPVATVDEFIGEFKVDREMDARLPRTVAVSYLDVDREYQ